MEHFLKVKKEYIEGLYFSQFQALPAKTLEDIFRICRIPATHAGKFLSSNSGDGASLMLINFIPFHQFQDLNFASHMPAFIVHGCGTTGSIFF